MRGYVISLAAGGLVGIIDGIRDVRSPAPPVVTLIGLLGMLIGEQVVPAAQRLMTVSASVLHGEKRVRPTHLRRTADEAVRQ
jgi:XapX domain-containing protein